MAHLEYLRDVSLPERLALLQDREEFLLEYGRRGAEASRQASQDLYGIQNGRKALIGRLAGLRDPALIEAKTKAERALRARIAAEPTRKPGEAAASAPPGNAISLPITAATKPVATARTSTSASDPSLMRPPSATPSTRQRSVGNQPAARMMT